MQWQSSRKMSQPEISRIGFLGVLCKYEFSVHFWKESKMSTEKSKMSAVLKSISEVFQDGPWPFAASRSSSEAAQPLGRQGTYGQVRDVDLCQKKTS